MASSEQFQADSLLIVERQLRVAELVLPIDQQIVADEEAESRLAFIRSLTNEELELYASFDNDVPEELLEYSPLDLVSSIKTGMYILEKSEVGTYDRFSLFGLVEIGKICLDRVDIQMDRAATTYLTACVAPSGIVVTKSVKDTIGVPPQEFRPEADEIAIAHEAVEALPRVVEAYNRLLVADDEHFVRQQLLELAK